MPGLVVETEAQLEHPIAGQHLKRDRHASLQIAAELERALPVVPLRPTPLGEERDREGRRAPALDPALILAREQPAALLGRGGEVGPDVLGHLLPQDLALLPGRRERYRRHRAPHVGAGILAREGPGPEGRELVAGRGGEGLDARAGLAQGGCRAGLALEARAGRENEERRHEHAPILHAAPTPEPSERCRPSRVGRNAANSRRRLDAPRRGGP